MAQKIRIKPGDSRWNDDFLKEHVGEKVVLCMASTGDLYKDLLRFERGIFMVERWVVSRSGDPEEFFDYLEIHSEEDFSDKFTGKDLPDKIIVNEEELEPARELFPTEEKKSPPKRAIYCSTREDIEIVIKKLKEIGKYQLLSTIDDIIVAHGEGVCLNEDGDGYTDYSWYKEEGYDIISALDWLVELSHGNIRTTEEAFSELTEENIDSSREFLGKKRLPDRSYMSLDVVNEAEDLPDDVAASDDYLRERYLKVGKEFITNEKDMRYISKFISDEAEEYFRTQPGLNNLSIKEKTMGIIKSAFKSKEVRALEHFGLTNGGKDLNDEGLEEFLAFLWETADKDTKNAFYKLVVDRYNEAKKRD